MYVTKFQSNGNTLVYSTFIGGSQNDKSYDIVVDGTNAAYVVGATESTSFPLSMDATQSTYGGGAYDGFITKLNSNGNNILFSTYLGGNDDDQINAIDLSKTNIFYNIHVTGRTASSNFPVTTSAYQTGFAGIFDAFVSKISYNGNLAFSTFIGGNGNDNSRDIKVINNMNYITGNTSNSFPTTTGSIDQSFNGVIDVFVSKLNSTGDQLIYSTYIGGSDIDYGLAIDVDTVNGYIYTAGQTYSSDFPLSFLTYQNTLDGSNDAFLAKICPISAYLTSTTGTDSQSVCVNNAIANITYMTSGVTNVTFTGLPGGVNGSFANDVITIAGTPNTAGTYNYSVNISSACGNITQTGTIVVNSCTSIEEFNQKIEFNVFPNPSNGNFQIVTNKPITIEIVDITGKVLNKYYINEKQKSIQENFSEGVYFIRDVDNNYFKKIIITK